MNSLETQIYQIISASNGVKGVDIATKLGIDRKTVNSVLSNSAALKAVVCQDGNYKWHIISEQSMRTPVNNNVVPTPDKDLQSICKYYLNCLALESSSSVSQFLTSDFSLKYAVLNGLAIYDHDASVLDLLTRISQNRDSKAYLGYPVKYIRFIVLTAVFGKLHQYSSSRLNIQEGKLTYPGCLLLIWKLSKHILLVVMTPFRLIWLT